MLCVVYVDDGIIAGKTQELVEAAFTKLRNAFEIRDMGESTDFRGIQIVRDRAARTLIIHQANNTAELVSRYHIGKTHLIPMCPRTKLIVEGPIMDRPERYPMLTGELQHLVDCTRPDLAKPVSALASFTKKPTNAHWDAALQVLSYVGGTANEGITYGTTDAQLVGYTDSDYAGMPGSRSTSGVVFMLFGGAISW